MTTTGDEFISVVFDHHHFSNLNFPHSDTAVKDKSLVSPVYHLNLKSDSIIYMIVEMLSRVFHLLLIIHLEISLIIIWTLEVWRQ